MAVYYVNKIAQEDGKHIVHKSGCKHLPDDLNRVYLGDYLSCKSAVLKSLEYFNNSNGCVYCSQECHTS